MGQLVDKQESAQTKRAVLRVIFFTFFCSGFMSIMLGNLVPYIQSSYGLDYAQTGAMLSAHQFGNLCAVVAAGFLPFTIGRKNSSILLGSGSVIGMLGIALTGNPVLLMISFALSGIGRGTMGNLCNTVASENAENKSVAGNLLHATFGVGALLAPVFVFVFAKTAIPNWTGAPMASAVLSLLALVLIGCSTISNQREARSESGSFEFLGSFSFWISTGILFFYLCAESSITGWFVTYFKDTGLLPDSVANFTTTMLWVMITIGRIICALLSTRVNQRKLAVVIGMMFTGFFLMLLLSNSSTMAIVSLLGIGISMSGIYPITLTFRGKYLSILSTGFCIAIAGVGAILMPIIVGFTADRVGLAGGVSLILGACIIMLILMVVNLFFAPRFDKVQK